MGIFKSVGVSGDEADRDYFMPSVWESHNTTEFLVKGQDYDYSTMTDYVSCKSYFVEFLQDRILACLQYDEPVIGWD